MEKNWDCNLKNRAPIKTAFGKIELPPPSSSHFNAFPPVYGRKYKQWKLRNASVHWLSTRLLCGDLRQEITKCYCKQWEFEKWEILLYKSSWKIWKPASSQIQSSCRHKSNTTWSLSAEWQIGGGAKLALAFFWIDLHRFRQNKSWSCHTAQSKKVRKYGAEMHIEGSRSLWRKIIQKLIRGPEILWWF